MKPLRLALAITVFVFLLTPSALADWFPGDDFKMHHPQLPDPNGWDVDVTTDTIYDDFLCTETGPINDLHFWVSWKQGLVGQIDWIDISLHADVPDPDGPGPEYSHPDSVMYNDPNTLWTHHFLPSDFIVNPYGNGLQGWYAPEEPLVIPDDHTEFFQVNIPRIDAPFFQQEGTIYWIGIHIGVADPGTAIGWKTTQDHFNDDATYYYGGWQELRDPETMESLDMAFVITPEPATLALFAIGGLILFRKR